MRKYNVFVFEVDKKVIIEDLEKIEVLRKSCNLIINYICLGYNIVEVWEKVVKVCERSLRKGDDLDIFYLIYEVYFGVKKYNKVINFLK